MSIIRPHRNNNCGDIHLFKPDCTKVMNNCEKHCGMPGLNSSITSDGSYDKPGCQLNAKGNALYDAYKKVEYPTHTYKLDGRKLTVDLKEAQASPNHLAILFNKGRDGMLSNNDYEKLKEWRDALREELALRSAFDRKCVWKRNDMKSYTTPGWAWWQTNFPGKVPNQDIDLTATGHQKWKDHLNSKIDKISRFIGTQEQEELDAAAAAEEAAAAKAKNAAAKMKQTEKNNRGLVEKAAEWMLENTLDNVFTTLPDKTIQLVTKVENDQIIMLAITLILLSHGLGDIEPEEDDRPRRSKRRAGKPADQERPLRRYLGITPPPRNRDRAVYHRLAKPKESPMDSFHTYTRVDKPLGVTATVSPNSRITDPLIIYVKYQQNNAKKQVVKTVLLTLLIRLKIAEIGAAKKDMNRQDILEEPENNYKLWEQEIFSAITKLYKEGRLIEDPVGELGRELKVNPEQLFVYALSDQSLYYLYKLSSIKFPTFIIPKRAERVDRITNIEFTTSNNSSQRIISQLYNLFDNTLKKLTQGSATTVLTLEEANDVRKTMAEQNIKNANLALKQLRREECEEELCNQLFNLAVCSLAAAQESWLDIIHTTRFNKRLKELEDFAKESGKTYDITKFIEQVREKQAKVEQSAAAAVENMTAVDLEEAEAAVAATELPTDGNLQDTITTAMNMTNDFEILETAINNAMKAGLEISSEALEELERRRPKPKPGTTQWTPAATVMSNSSLAAAEEPSEPVSHDFNPDDVEMAINNSLNDS